VDINNVAPKTAGVTTRDFHKRLDIFPVLLTPSIDNFFAATILEFFSKLRVVIDTCGLGILALNTILVFAKLTTN
jgi:hypothetical protein